MKRRIIRYNSALISVLCLIFTAGILLASTLSLSKSGTFTVAAHVKMQRSMLISEGVANRVQWLLAADRNLHPDDKPGTVDYTAYEYDRFMGDAVIHTMDYYGENVQVQIWDAVKGFDMSQSSYAAAINRISSQEDAGDDISSSESGRFFLNPLSNSPAICSQSQQLPPLPARNRTPSF